MNTVRTWVQRTIGIVRRYLKKYQAYVTPTALVVGFVADNFTLNRIDQVFDNLVLVTHLVIVGVTAALLFGERSRIGRIARTTRNRGIYVTLMVFSLGGLFSGYMVFYMRAGAIARSWPLLVLFLAVMVGAETGRRYVERSVMHISLWYAALTLYLLFFIPIVFNTLGVGMFIVSSLVALLGMVGYGWWLRHLNRARFMSIRTMLVVSVIGVTALFQLLYFTNIIPPVPLSLKSAAPYHMVERSGPGQYEGTYEPTAPINVIRKRSRIIRRREPGPVYVFASVFAPHKITTTIYHVWQRRNDLTGEWVQTDRIPITIAGGRDGGFRGYTRKAYPADGRWRVLIVTDRNQIVGREIFEIATTPPKRDLITESLD